MPYAIHSIPVTSRRSSLGRNWVDLCSFELYSVAFLQYFHLQPLCLAGSDGKAKMIANAIAVRCTAQAGAVAGEAA